MGRYNLHLVEDPRYAAAISRLSAGDGIGLVPEPENQDDPRAIKGVDITGETIGYVERDSWLTRAMLDDSLPITARVHEIVGSVPGSLAQGVVLEVLTSVDAVADTFEPDDFQDDEPAGPPDYTDRNVFVIVMLGGMALVAFFAFRPEAPSREDTQATAFAAASPLPAPGSGLANHPAISAIEFDQLQEGMSYSNAIDLIGSPGELLSQTDIAGYRTVMYQWRGKGLGANANVTFQNNRLISKAQFGLD